jgi:hypothetical protein
MFNGQDENILLRQINCTDLSSPAHIDKLMEITFLIGIHLLHHREIGIDLFWIDNIDSAAPPSSSLSKCRSIWEEWIRLLARLKRNDDPFTSYFFSHGSFTDDHEISKRPVIR